MDKLRNDIDAKLQLEAAARHDSAATMTAADVAVFSSLNLLERSVGIDWSSTSPKVAAICEKVQEMGTIPEYLADAPPCR